jgi:hypothetical protein
MPVKKIVLLLIFACYYAITFGQEYKSVAAELLNKKELSGGYICRFGIVGPVKVKTLPPNKPLKIIGVYANRPEKFMPNEVVQSTINKLVNLDQTSVPKKFKCYWEELQSYRNMYNTYSIRDFSLSVSSATYFSSLGFFCQKELLLDRLTPLPLRFRLGSLDYVNWMEQKPNAIKPGR